MSMVFPGRLDYETVIKRLDIFASDSSIKTGRVIMRRDGLFPQIYSGGRAVVFPVLIGDEKFAIKCWIQALGALAERYKFISSLIQESRPPYLIDSIYREDELLFDGTRYPVLQMRWSESETLKEWITSNVNNSGHLVKMASNFLDITIDMHKLKMSHGDLQHENILVNSNCEITLVDYDSIYLPGLDHLDDEIKGLPGFQHSSRARQLKASAKSDYLSEYAIYISLMALSERPDLWEAAKNYNRLLFSQEDINNPKASELFGSIRSIKSLSDLIDAFESQCLCSTLNDISPLESVIPARNSSIPTTKKSESQSSQQKSETQPQPKAFGKASDLRNAKGWHGARGSKSEWSFERLISKSNEKAEADQSRMAASSVESTNEFNDRPKTIVSTLGHAVTGSLYGVKINTGLISVSFEGTFLRFSCQPFDGNIGSEILLSKSKINRWRRVNSSIELYVTSFDFIVVSSLDSACLESIKKIAQGLELAKIALADNSEASEHAYNDDIISSAHGSSHPRSIPISSPTKAEEEPLHIRKFSYSSIQDIAYCTGKSSFAVEVVADLLQVKPPFSLVEADRIAGKLVGYPSIRRAYDRVRCSSDLLRRSSKREEDSGESPVALDSPSNPTASNTYNHHGKSYGGHMYYTYSPPQTEIEPSMQSSSARQFSYSSIQDIAYCTGRSSYEVENAAKSFGISPPFALFEADRIAEILVGDPSIRKAYEKIRCSPDSPKTSSSKKQNPVDIQIASSSSSSSSKSAVSTSSNDCFVATAIYGTADHPDLSSLRLYRDTFLKSSSVGRIFIYCYYRVGPYIAHAIERSGLSPILRPLMSFIVHIVTSRK